MIETRSSRLIYLMRSGLTQHKGINMRIIFEKASRYFYIDVFFANDFYSKDNKNRSFFFRSMYLHNNNLITRDLFTLSFTYRTSTHTFIYFKFINIFISIINANKIHDFNKKIYSRLFFLTYPITRVYL